MNNLSAALQRNAQVNPNRTAVVFNETRLTYAQLNGAANQVANGLRSRGIKPGDKVALSCPNLPYFPIVYYGILKAGAVVVPMNVLFTPREVSYHLEDSGAKAYFCFEGTPELPIGQNGLAGYQEVDTCEQFYMITADPAAQAQFDVPTLGMLMHLESPVADYEPRTGEDTAVILYTSGTTGRPKGAELTHGNMTINAFVSQGLMKMDANDVHLVTLPLFHVFGQTTQMNAGILSGSTLVLVPRFDPDVVLGLLERENVTIFAGVPTMYVGLLNCPDAETKYDLEKIANTLRLGVSGGASMPVEVMKGFEAKFNVPILEGYGLSETSPVACFNHLDRERLPGSVGQPVNGVEIRIVDGNDLTIKPEHEGEVVIRGHNIMNGYIGRPDATAESIRNGWFHTGDIGKFDADGNLYIVDRLKDMIIRGGYNVYPREVEEVLMTQGDIALVAVLGVPHPVHGEEIKAYVVPKPGKAVEAETVIAYAKEHLAGYKYPRQVEVRATLPMTATGKILKKELRKESEQPAQAETV